ncbi:hypothetical protein M885DRAFT_522035 [Pelagophyceae sp. CCMP2097]|nr:hypothetical protein M885DRAFT_522035 [Pelagophyceae sp. CCMP2097]|mmetsp:Transcript_23807/g.81367  ORF Transcript_23807/g.81367 Transcript_23807/m.81367 type:complete len:318 (-) Transcript_23807:79-1032(-)
MGKKTLLVLKAAAGDDFSGAIETIALEHPRGGKALFLRRGARLLELQRRAPVRGSFLVGEESASDGALLVAAPFDARFLVLALLTAQDEKRRLQFARLEDLVSAAAGEASRDAIALLDLDLGDVGAMCAVNDKHGADLRLLRLDAGKAVDWLTTKVKNVAKALAQQGGAAAADDAPAAFQASSAAPASGDGAGGPSRRDVLRAVQAVSDYVSDEWATQLAQKHGFELADVFAGAKRPSTPGDAPTASTAAPGAAWAYDADEQRQREFAFGRLPAAGKAAGIKPVETTKQKQLAKTASQIKMKSMTSFFAPAPKKPKT